MRDQVVAACLALALSANPVLAGSRDDQWVFRSATGDGTPAPTAVFMSWNYDAIVFRATCDAAQHELVIDYYGDGEVALRRSDAIELGESAAIRLRTKLVARRLEGRSPITPRLLKFLSGARQLDIGAPNAMGEAWHVGSAAALLKVAKACR